MAAVAATRPVAIASFVRRGSFLLAPRRLAAAVGAVLCALATPSPAERWIDPGDLAFRSDLQLVSDAGLYDGPVTTWPVAVDDLARVFLHYEPPVDLKPWVRDAALRIARRVSAEADRDGWAVRASVHGANDAERLRGFADTPREQAGAALTVDGHTGSLDYRLAASYLPDAADGRDARLDGSRVGVRAGNWRLSLGAVPRWWGPGWQGGLIQSTSARPVPALTVENVRASRFSTPWLSWIGAYRLVLFAGELESGRTVPNARLLGARFNFRPVDGLDVGLSRTAQWGGEGRPESLDSLLDLILGRDNVGDGGVNVDNEPGNQLGGIDIRWRSPVGDLPYALYLEWIGEDEAGGLPSRFLGLGGGEVWGPAPWGDGHYRLRIEAADTATEFYKSQTRYNTAYEHGAYQSGYRYRGASLGHVMDNDGVMVSVAAALVRPDGTSWDLSARRVLLNRDGTNRRQVHTQSLRGEEAYELRLSGTRPAWGGELAFGASAWHGDPRADSGGFDGTVFVQWSTGPWGAQ